MASTTSLMVLPVAGTDGPHPLDRPVLRGEAAGPGDVLVEHRPWRVERDGRRLVADTAGDRLEQRGGHPGRLGGDAERRTQCGHRQLRQRRLGRSPGCCSRLGAGRSGRPGRPACCAGRGRWRARWPAAASPRRRRRARGGSWCTSRPGRRRSPSTTCASHSGRSQREPLAVQPRREVEQLAHPPGPGQRAVPDVVLDVEVLVLHPHQLAGGAERAVRPLEEQRRDLLGGAQPGSYIWRA